MKNIYLKYDYEDAKVRNAPDGWYVKLKGQNEFKAPKGNKIVPEAYRYGENISKEEYDKTE